MTVLSMPASEFPYPIEGCAEVFFYKINTPLDEPSGRTGSSQTHALLTIFPGIIINLLHIVFLSSLWLTKDAFKYG